MNAGPELDALIAEKIMGWTKHAASDSWLLPDGKLSGWSLEGRIYDECDHLTWNPSDDIAAAWEVVLKLNAEPNRTFTMLKQFGEANFFWCGFKGDSSQEEYGETAPLAICRAALKAIEEP